MGKGLLTGQELRLFVSNALEQLPDSFLLSYFNTFGAYAIAKLQGILLSTHWIPPNCIGQLGWDASPANQRERSGGPTQRHSIAAQEFLTSAK